MLFDIVKLNEYLLHTDLSQRILNTSYFEHE